MKEDLFQPDKFHIRLLAMVSHDVKVPLENILFLLELYKDNPPAPNETEEFLETLKVQVEASHNLFSELLNWSKTHFIRSTYDTVFNLRRVTDEVIDSVGFYNLNKNVFFFNHICLEFNLYGYYLELYKFVLRNLLINSIKFSHPNGICEIEAKQEKDYYRISITDEGIGMPREQMEKIFSYKEGSRTGTGREAGSGLGLLLCRDCLSEFGGDLRIESEQGKGSRVYFTIPSIRMY